MPNWRRILLLEGPCTHTYLDSKGGVETHISCTVKRRVTSLDLKDGQTEQDAEFSSIMMGPLALSPPSQERTLCILYLIHYAMGPT